MVKFHGTLLDMMVPAHAVVPYPDNPRATDTEPIVHSITRNGVYRPIYAQESTGYIVGGHHLFAALMELGLEQVPVMWLDVDDATAKRILIADNRIPDLGTYDDGLVLKILDEIALEDELGLMGTGYDVAEMERLRKTMDEPLRAPDAPPDSDELPSDVCPECGQPRG